MCMLLYGVQYIYHDRVLHRIFRWSVVLCLLLSICETKGIEEHASSVRRPFVALQQREPRWWYMRMMMTTAGCLYNMTSRVWFCKKLLSTSYLARTIPPLCFTRPSSSSPRHRSLPLYSTYWVVLTSVAQWRDIQSPEDVYTARSALCCGWVGTNIESAGRQGPITATRCDQLNPPLHDMNIGSHIWYLYIR